MVTGGECEGSGQGEGFDAGLAAELVRAWPEECPPVPTLQTSVCGAGGPPLAHWSRISAAIAAYPVGVVAQMTRAALIEEYGQNHARMERSLGFSRFQVLSRFSLRPASGPVLALLALVFAFSLVNAFLGESIFNWPGLGRYAADAIRSSDTPAIAGVTIAVALSYVVLNLLVDVAHAALDPRVRLR